MSTAKQEADKLREEAKKWLNEMFVGALNIHTGDDVYKISIQGVERAVDCIIGAAILEVADMQTVAQQRTEQDTCPLCLFDSGVHDPNCENAT